MFGEGTEHERLHADFGSSTSGRSFLSSLWEEKEHLYKRRPSTKKKPSQNEMSAKNRVFANKMLENLQRRVELGLVKN